MNKSDKLILLVSLSFFFACLAISLVSLHGSSQVESYMYTPQAEHAQAAPIDAVTRQYGRALPKSVLHYPLDTPAPKSTVTCYLKDAYEKRIAELIDTANVRLAVRASMEPDIVEIYVNKEGEFSVFVIGPDAIEQPEACEVAAGTGWQAVNP